MDGSGFNFEKPELFKAGPKPGLAGRAGPAQHYIHDDKASQEAHWNLWPSPYRRTEEETCSAASPCSEEQGDDCQHRRQLK